MDRPELPAGTTHVVHFGHTCGAGWWERHTGKGMWEIIAAADYASGAAWSPGEGWLLESPRNTPAAELAAWVSRRAGFPVVLIRADHLLDRHWKSQIAYRAVRDERNGQ